MPLQQVYYPQVVDEPIHFGSYHMPMTPSEFGSDHDSPYCSPRPMAHAEAVYMPGSGSLPTEKTHTTSGVGYLGANKQQTADPVTASASTKSSRPTSLPRTQRKARPRSRSPTLDPDRETQQARSVLHGAERRIRETSKND